MNSTSVQQDVLSQELKHSLSLSQNKCKKDDTSVINGQNNNVDATVNGEFDHSCDLSSDVARSSISIDSSDCLNIEQNVLNEIVEDFPSDDVESDEISQDSDCSDDEDDVRNKNSRAKYSSPKSGSSVSNFEDSSDSDWEENKFENLRNFEKIYMHPTESEEPDFVPSDLHVSLISSQMEVWHSVEDGQFDDADL